MSEITQADRDAADEHFDLWYPNTAWGYDPLVEAFARHRLAERAKIVAWLRGFATNHTDDLADILETQCPFDKEKSHDRD